MCPLYAQYIPSSTPINDIGLTIHDVIPSANENENKFLFPTKSFLWIEQVANVTFSNALIPTCPFSGKETDVAIVWIGAWRKSILDIWTAQQEFSLKYEVKLLAYLGLMVFFFQGEVSLVFRILG